MTCGQKLWHEMPRFTGQEAGELVVEKLQLVALRVNLTVVSTVMLTLVTANH